ncbi:hypothetical protein FIV42_17760 [Persicimonas caeni]|uniref:Dickkopf N-terminal cysteine-rich domain-containing protein n=1 Tax=Persicimonas caeni TaxID=2292766 RepID=A0A4Y6PW04_PERCE|nr:hypothetical protein [Persicimonas caeni]QDG52512.1 hypothetical protein FIV42_17760 [Persicimonas caeni]QED33734.1 hypothetical protein FRD00_17755 [Persicimonas caeni]
MTALSFRLVLVCRLALLGALLCTLTGTLAACSDPPPPKVGDACSSLSDCLGGTNLVCDEGACAVIGCDSAAECPGESTCVDSICGPAECATGDDCADGAVCWSGWCVEDGCLDKSACDRGQVCLGTPPMCTAPPEQCTSDRQCPTGETCLVDRRRCTPQCTDDADCPSFNYCLEGLCREPCRDDAECPGELSCVDDRCTELPDCSDAPACSGLRPYRDPLTCACVGCLANSDCDLTRQEFCTTDGQCLLCAEPGSSDEDCASRGQYYVDGCCTECLDDTHCPTSQAPYCERGRCVGVDGPDCIAQSDCADGLVCDRGACIEPPSYAACDTQGDCPQGEACYADGLCRAASEVCTDCPTPSRCVAEPGDQTGTCAGCTAHCDADGCPDGQVCFVTEGSAEGVCVDAELSGC